MKEHCQTSGILQTVSESAQLPSLERALSVKKRGKWLGRRCRDWLVLSFRGWDYCPGLLPTTLESPENTAPSQRGLLSNLKIDGICPASFGAGSGLMTPLFLLVSPFGLGISILCLTHCVLMQVTCLILQVHRWRGILPHESKSHHIWFIWVRWWSLGLQIDN